MPLSPKRARRRPVVSNDPKQIRLYSPSIALARLRVTSSAQLPVVAPLYSRARRLVSFAPSFSLHVLSLEQPPQRPRFAFGAHGEQPAAEGAKGAQRATHSVGPPSLTKPPGAGVRQAQRRHCRAGRRQAESHGRHNTGHVAEASLCFSASFSLAGPSSSPYEGGVFLIDIRLPAEYPFEPPKARAPPRTPCRLTKQLAHTPAPLTRR